MKPRRTWAEWLNSKLDDAERAARDAWYDARRLWYSGTDAVGDLVGRRGPQAMRALGDVLRTSREGYQDTMRQAPESMRNIGAMMRELEANPPAPPKPVNARRKK